MIRSAIDVLNKYMIELKKFEWIMLNVQLSVKHKIHLLKLIEKNKPIAVSFQRSDVNENPC